MIEKKKKKKQKRKLEITWGRGGGEGEKGEAASSESARIDARQNWILLVNVANKMQGRSSTIIYRVQLRKIAASCIDALGSSVSAFQFRITQLYRSVLCVSIKRKKKKLSRPFRYSESVCSLTPDLHLRNKKWKETVEISFLIAFDKIKKIFS